MPRDAPSTQVHQHLEHITEKGHQEHRAYHLPPGWTQLSHPGCPSTEQSPKQLLPSEPLKELKIPYFSPRRWQQTRCTSARLKVIKRQSQHLHVTPHHRPGLCSGGSNLREGRLRGRGREETDSATARDLNPD
ncbi:uncharacterized protein AAES06_019352 [Glossophaga mutica]